MNFWFANTTNHKRILIFVISGVFGFLANLGAYHWTLTLLTIREFINTAIVGLLTFEFLFRTRKFLSLKTLAIYAILAVVASRWLYVILGSIESGAVSIKDIYFNPFENIFSTRHLIPSLFATILAYFLIFIYRNESSALPSDYKFVRERTINFLHRLTVKDNFGMGFFGWFLVSNLVLFVSLILDTGLDFAWAVFGILWVFTVITPIVLFRKKRISMGKGIIVAVILNAALLLWILGGKIKLTEIGLLLAPMPTGIFLFMQ